MGMVFNYFRVIIKYFLVMTLSAMALSPSVVLAQTINKKYRDFDSVSSPWFVTGELGYANYSDMYFNDGQTPLGRISIGRALGKASIFNFAVEAGIQNGNAMRLPLSPEAEAALGDIIPSVSAKPIMDLLLTVKTDALSERVPVFALFKIGPAYQRWVFTDRDTIDDKTQLSLEGQVGLGYWINDRTSISLSYQRIFGATPNWHMRDDEQNTAYIGHLPTQQAVLFGISMNL